jgi:hypothetical protein
MPCLSFRIFRNLNFMATVLCLEASHFAEGVRIHAVPLYPDIHDRCKEVWSAKDSSQSTVYNQMALCSVFLCMRSSFWAEGLVNNFCCNCRGFTEGTFCITPFASFRRPPVTSGSDHIFSLVLPFRPSQGFLRTNVCIC